MGPIEQLSYILPTCSSVVDRIQVMQMDDPTPCEKFTVRQILEHMMVPAATFTYMFQGQEAPEITLPDFDGRVPSAEFREVMNDLLEAVMSPGALERTIDSPFGTMDGDTFARLVAFDGLVHSWDLATATGQQLALPPAGRRRRVELRTWRSHRRHARRRHVQAADHHRCCGQRDRAARRVHRPKGARRRLTTISGGHERLDARKAPTRAGRTSRELRMSTISTVVAGTGRCAHLTVVASTSERVVDTTRIC